MFAYGVYVAETRGRGGSVYDLTYLFFFSLLLGDNAAPVTPPVNSKSKSRKETLAALAAAQKNKGSASSRKRKERNRSAQAKRTSGKDWRKTVNGLAPDDKTDKENERCVARCYFF